MIFIADVTNDDKNLTNVDHNVDNQHFLYGGNTTKDKIFFLSDNEVKSYFWGIADRITIPTQ